MKSIFYALQIIRIEKK